MEAPLTPAAPNRIASIAPVLAWTEAVIGGLFALLYLGAIVSQRAADTTDIASCVLFAGGAAFLAWGAIRVAKPEWHAEPVTSAVGWSGFDVAMGMVGGFIGGQLVGLLVAGLGAAFAGGPSTLTTAVVSVVAQLCLYAGLIGNAYVFALAHHGSRLRDLGWRMPRRIGPVPGAVWLIAAVAIAAFTVVAGSLVVWATESLLPGSTNVQCQEVRNQYGGAAVAAVAAISVLAPLFEETIFRGFVYRYCARRWHVLGGILVSAAIFSLFHVNFIIFPGLVVVGAILAATYEASDSLFPGMIVHALFNLWNLIGILNAGSGC